MREEVMPVIMLVQDIPFHFCRMFTSLDLCTVEDYLCDL